MEEMEHLMLESWSFHSAGQIIFGRNSVRRLGEVAKQLQAKRILIVTDRVLESAGILDRVRQPLAESGAELEVFNGGEAEPSLRAAEASIQCGRTFQPDAVLGLGGGSNMDLAKITATILAHGGAPRDYIGEFKIPGPILPLICVPTTAGTGSEVSAASVLTDTENQIKVGILSNYLRPRVAVVDPLMTLSCPAKVTADSGIDALTHAIEAYTAVDNADFPIPGHEKTVYQGRHPLADALAAQAVTLIGANLRKAVKNGNDLEAREGMALAATLAGLAFSNVGVAAVHALEYPVGAATHCSHGAGNGLLLPYVMRFNLPVRQREFAKIAIFLGEDAADIACMGEIDAAEEAIQIVTQLRADIGIPLRLRDLGVRQEQLRPFAEKAFGIKRILRVNPRPVTVQDLEGILQAAF
jgi:alcohol dehydrogenase class IV